MGPNVLPLGTNCILVDFEHLCQNKCSYFHQALGCILSILTNATFHLDMPVWKFTSPIIITCKITWFCKAEDADFRVSFLSCSIEFIEIWS